MCRARVIELISYPVKGYAGVRLQDATVTPAGLAHDRSFMVVDPAGVFRSQRRDPRLAMIRPEINPPGTWLALHAPGTAPVSAAVDPGALTRELRSPRG